MGVAKLMVNKKKANVNTVLGIDASTHSLAFCLYDESGPVRWGEIIFKGASVFERLAFAQRSAVAMKKELKADLIVFEGSIYVQNKKTVILLAYATGAIVSGLISKGARVEDVSPMTWQNFIGNKALSKSEKDAIRRETPDKSATWYSNKFREFRKNRTKQWCKEQFGIELESDNVSDAVGVAHFGYHTYSEGEDD